MIKKIKKKSSTFTYINSPYTKEIQKRINIAEISLGDFAGRMSNDLLKWFSLTAQHWIMLHMVMLAYYKNETITKNQLLKFQQEDLYPSFE